MNQIRLQESIRSQSKLTSSKSHSVSFFNSKSESSEGVFGDLLDTESEDSDERVEWQETGSESSAEHLELQ
ncbi:hypothetical protein pdam_00022467 [Pocillopora damicornis]|uniref:Uncharacterized protein n=1 Tax=Pocillopora damicornis TaxID=46731 RepID=A0A3M6UI39_POCDA|nr:hypothetical protein pdam_00022467 [Pocillopora damicornis]